MTYEEWKKKPLNYCSVLAELYDKIPKGMKEYQSPQWKEICEVTKKMDKLKKNDKYWSEYLRDKSV